MARLDDEIGLKIHRLRQEAKRLTEVADRLLEELDLSEGSYISGDFIIKVRPTVRFDAATAERNLSPEDFKSILKEKPDSALAKALLGEKYSKTQKVYGLTKSVERVEVE
jgi:hypothetical protein